ncbi:hypothetical protein [uncultured Tateyamaria sp.]|uniref:hypothetical protein n=1 Tax=Tateyamaria sp. 1078 TaxID=3417464 RepID=UPI002621949B|nr:hypothetical protein [uncultured Tateyamaria sp.]
MSCRILGLMTGEGHAPKGRWPGHLDPSDATRQGSDPQMIGDGAVFALARQACPERTRTARQTACRPASWG